LTQNEAQPMFNTEKKNPKSWATPVIFKKSAQSKQSASI
jgi:hypothetical protein